MVELDHMRLFRALGVSPSLAAAARLLKLTPPAVTIRSQRLEERLGSTPVQPSHQKMAAPPPYRTGMRRFATTATLWRHPALPKHLCSPKE